MLGKRILTAAIGIPLVVLLVHTGGALFAGAILFLQCVALYEFNNMTVKKGAGMHLFSGIVFSVLLCLSAFYYNDTSKMFLLVVLALILTMLQGVFNHKKSGWLQSNLYTLFTVGYIGMFFSLFILLRQSDMPPIESRFGQMQAGEAFLWLCLIGTWLSDTCAFFVGTAIGKHKLCPAISPNKSWEGAVAGFLGGVASVWLFGQYVFPVQNISLLIFGTLVAFSAPLGDLVESQIKRFFDVKDSGNIFPGHGGVLDRLDSLLFVIPVIYIYLNFAIG